MAFKICISVPYRYFFKTYMSKSGRSKGRPDFFKGFKSRKMAKLLPRCFKSVDGHFSCPDCEGGMVKNGRTKDLKQRYICRHCRKTSVIFYQNQACNKETNTNIIALTKEGCGIRSTARLLCISVPTLLSRLRSIASKISQSAISLGKTYEVDELRTYVRSKTNQIWLVYALEREAGQIVTFHAGKRNNRTLKVVTESLAHAGSKAVFTDRLSNYESLISKRIHKTRLWGSLQIQSIK